MSGCQAQVRSIRWRERHPHCYVPCTGPVAPPNSRRTARRKPLWTASTTPRPHDGRPFRGAIGRRDVLPAMAAPTRRAQSKDQVFSGTDLDRPLASSPTSSSGASPASSSGAVAGEVSACWRTSTTTRTRRRSSARRSSGSSRRRGSADARPSASPSTATSPTPSPGRSTAPGFSTTTGSGRASACRS